jgi:hypothetical protein
MAFSLIGAPGTFQKAMYTTLAPLLRKCVLVFFDDILVYSASFEDHVVHLQQVFELLFVEQWKIKLPKCAFATNQVAYLGHLITQQGVATNASKISAISSWLVPQIVKVLRGFLGLAGYYHKFVKHFSIISQPLTKLLKKNTLFIWTADQESAFVALKQALVSALVLALPNFNKLFVLETDASEARVGAVLMQDRTPFSFYEQGTGS